jgi:hypothetical protein
MHDPIEGQFSVVGEKPPYEPVVKNWPGLTAFIVLTALGGVLNTGRIMLENNRLECARDGRSYSAWSATCKEPLPVTFTIEKLPK